MPNSEKQIEYVEPDSLNPAPYNPRRISDGALNRLAKLLDSHGFIDPVIARREDRLLIGGHQRLKANKLRKKPDAKIPCVFLDKISDAKAKALNIALNNPNAQGEWELPDLSAILQEINVDDIDIEALTGFNEKKIADLVHTIDESFNKPSDEDWASQFEQNGDTSIVDGLQQITFVLAKEDFESLMSHLKRYDVKRNIAVMKWLKASL